MRTHPKCSWFSTPTNMIKKLLTFAAIIALFIPVAAFAQVFSQSQLINTPYGSNGFVVSTTTANGAKLSASSTPYFANFFAGNGTINSLTISGSCVGCGGSSVGEAWSIQGNGYLAPTTTKGIIVSASSTIGAGGQATGLTINGGATTTGNAAFTATTGTTSISAGQAFTVGSTKFVVQGGGNVGIGTVNPIFTADVNGKLRSTSYLLGNGPDLSLEPVASGQSALTAWHALQLVGFKNSTVDYTPSNVGIGIDAYGVVVPMQSTVATGLAVLGFASQTANYFEVTSNANKTTLHGDVFGITSGGQVGVGTTSPFATLSVAGDIFANGNLTASNITATGTLSVTGNTTLTNATSTSFFATTASTTKLWGANLQPCTGTNALTYSAGLFGCAAIPQGTITALTGDVTASGSGSVAATLATVNSNVGSFGGVNSIPSFTVNAKGLITAAAANTPSIPASEITSGTFGSGNSAFPNDLAVAGNVNGSGQLNVGGVHRAASYNGLHQFFADLTVGSTLEMIDTTTGTAGVFIGFTYNNTSPVGNISTNGSSVAYNTTSDHRVKENIATTTAGIDTLMQISIEDFNFKSDPNKSRVQGFIAQDLYKYYPEAVTTNGDNGTISLATSSRPWSVDYGRITPLLVQSIKDVNTNLASSLMRIAQLEAKNAELEKRLQALEAKH